MPAAYVGGGGESRLDGSGAHQNHLIGLDLAAVLDPVGPERVSRAAPPSIFLDMSTRFAPQMHADLTRLLERGDVGIVALPLIELAVTAAVAKNTLEVAVADPLGRTIARELDRKLDGLDTAIAETLLLPA